jgi:hypothetical protein
MRHHNLQVTGSVVVNGLGLATTADLNTYTASADAKISTLQAFTASVGTTNTFTASASNRLDSIETITTSNIARLNSLENLTGSLATTGSNTFYGQQIFSGSLYVQNELIVQGSSSLQNITASAVSIGTNIVYLNTDTPAVRFAGLTVQDSGSSAGVTGSMLWDSLCNRWIYSNPSTIGYSGGMLLSGPRASTLGTETTLTCNYVAKSGGGDHLYDSCIIDDGTTTCVKNNFISTGTGLFCGQLNSITGVFGNKGGGNYGVLITDNDQSNVRLKFTNSGTGGQSMSIVGGNPGLSNTGLAFYDETNTSTRMYINSGGCIGVNTNNPQSIFDVQNCINSPYNSTNTLISNQWFRTSNPSTCTGATSGIMFVAAGPGGGNGLATINGVTTSCGSMAITFGTRNASGAVTERMRIASNGLVGIGTDTPTLHTAGDIGGLVVKGVGGRGIIEVHDGNSAGKAVFQQINGTTYLGNLDKATGTGELQLLVDGLGTSATAAMVLTRCGHIVVNNAPNGQTDYGRFTISTSTPKTSDPNTQEKTALHLSTCESDTPFGMKFQLVGGTCTCTRYVGIQTGDHYISNQGNIAMQVSGGHVGIGTTDIGYKLTVFNTDSANTGLFRLYASSGAYTATMADIGSESNSSSYTLFNVRYGSGMTNTAFKVRGDGNVGVGTASPFAKLTVAGTIANISAAGNDNYTIDTMNAYQSISNGGWVDFNGMSGFLMVNNWTNGATTLFVMGGGNTAVVGTVTGTAGTTHHNPNVGGYRWCNNSGSTALFGFQVFRTRNTA